MSLNAITCGACGGAIALQAGKRFPACLFCGSEALSEKPMAEGVEAPEVFLAFETDLSAATGSFQKFTRSSIWYPSDLRDATVELNQVLLPAWSWSGRVEGHYAALVSASTRSGKRPVSGTDSGTYKGVMVPSSKAISRAELGKISPFDADKAKDIAAEGPGLPYEIGALTRTAARAQGCEAMEERHKASVRSSLRASDLRMSAIFHDVEGRPLLLPIWIGAYRRKEKMYRVVINGQTGKLTGEAPLSFWRIAFAVSLVLGLLGALALATSGGVAAKKASSGSTKAPSAQEEPAEKEPTKKGPTERERQKRTQTEGATKQRKAAKGEKPERGSP